MIKRARMCKTSQPSKGEKRVEVRRWDERMTKTARGSATRGVESRFRLNQQV